MCGGYWPAEQRLYLTNREMFFQRLEIRSFARRSKIESALSLRFFGILPTVPDLVGEPMAELGNTNSRSITLIRAYTADVIKRYSASPAIWAWEFGNEAISRPTSPMPPNIVLPSYPPWARRRAAPPPTN